MLDTIRVSAHVLLWQEIIENWEAVDGKPYLKAITYYLPNGASIYFSYNISTQYLTLQFSASKVQNDTNTIAYDFSKYLVCENEIEKVIEETIGISIETCSFNITRDDLNRDFAFDDEESNEEFKNFMNKILPARCEKRENYPTGFTSQTAAGNGFRVYDKRCDPHLSEKELEEMQSSFVTRVEFQLDRKMSTRYYGKRFNLHEILTNEFAAKMVWNKQLRKYGLDKKIVNRKTLDKIARKYLTEAEQEILAQMNDEPEFEDKKLRRKQLKVVRKMTALGICPYSCEIEIDLKVSTIEELLNFRKKREFKKWETSFQNTKSQTQTIRRIIKFIDDSS